MNLATVILPAIVSMLSANGVEPPEGAGILHPLAVIAGSPARVEGMETTILSPMEAARVAVDHLLSLGATDVLVCEVHRIEAPLTGYLVDATGSMEMDLLSNGVCSGVAHYGTFRIVLRDGAEYDGELYAPGELISFIARGVDSTGEVVWHPPCGPDYVPARDEPDFPDSMFQFEFLLWREDFESLASRYPRPEPGGADE